MSRSSLLSAAAAAVMATLPCAASAGPFDGPYVGAFGSYSRTDFARTATSSAVNVSGSTASDAFGLGLMAGYGLTFGSFYVGVEGEIGWDNLRGDVANTNLTTLLDAEASYGGALKLGVQPFPSIIAYGIAGRQWTEFTQTNRASVVTLGAGDGRAEGWRYGGGLALALGGPSSGNNLIASLEYTNTQYEVETVQVNLFRNRADVDQHRMRAAIAYRF